MVRIPPLKKLLISKKNARHYTDNTTQCLLTARRRTAYRHLRPAAASLSEEASSGIVFQPADRRGAGWAPRRHRGAGAGTLSSAGKTIRRHRGRDGEVEGQRTAVVGAEDERHPKPSERDRDAENCIWVTSKRGSMTSACFIYSSGRMKKDNVRNNIKNFRNNVIVLSELCQTKSDIVPNFTRARGQKLSGTSASLLIDSCARTSAS